MQKLLHRVVMWRPITEFFASRLHRIDKAIMKLTNGKISDAGILGWPIIQITTIGAKTKQPRTMPLIGVFDQEKIALVASSFGREHNPGWYYNLKAHPECDVYFNGCTERYMAHETTGEEYNRYWKLALSYYSGYEKYRQHAAHRHIPVMLLEPVK